ncbi:hydrogenase iron-sulfur subunit [bacterium]|nr:hydrogenase iron-sulfur subunit [bacterium]
MNNGHLKTEPKIVVFACNWCSYAGADTAGVNRVQYSSRVRVIRTMCSGRIHPAFVLRAFARGADAVLITGCHLGDCHYISGNERAIENFDIIKQLTALLGIEEERIGLEWISAAEGPRFGQVMDEFVARVTKLGMLPQPLASLPEELASINLELQPKDFGTLLCYECGKCTAVCPVAEVREEFSPRQAVRGHAVSANGHHPEDNCLTCGLCDYRCPQDVSISSFMAAERAKHMTPEEWGMRPHGGIFQAIGSLMTRDELRVQRTNWIPEDARTNPESDTLLYVGCAPFHDAFFQDLKVKNLKTVKGALKILNHLGIEPAVLDDERCCGHDFFWGGDLETFKRLAFLNVQRIAATKAKRIVFTCPECLYAYKELYAKVGIKIDAELVPVSQVIAEHADELKLEPVAEILTIQDPCRLSRHLGDTESLRDALAAVPGLSVKEMAHSGKTSICCAGNWVNCDAATKQLQSIRLREATATGAKVLATACPKCEIHLKCALKGNEEIQLEIRDITAIIADALPETVREVVGSD